jgi:hypothetical protein
MKVTHIIKKVNEIFANYGNFLTSLIILVLFSLLPILLEVMFTSKFTEKTTTISASMFAVTIGSASKFKVIFIFSMFACVLNAFSYGICFSNVNTQHLQIFTLHNIIATITIIFLIIILICERYFRHVIDNEPFLEFK